MNTAAAASRTVGTNSMPQMAKITDQSNHDPGQSIQTEPKSMKRPLQIFSLTALIAAASIITAVVITPANANKRASIEASDIAFVDVFTLVDRALSADDMSTARNDFNAKSTQSISGIQQQLQMLQTQLSTMQQDDPTAGDLYKQYQQLQYQLDNASTQINSDYQKLIANQIATAYSAIYGAANEIGHAQGFTFIFATRSDGELVQKDTITGITQEILARPLMTPPTGVDLTEEVRVKLGYPEKEAATTDDAQEGAASDDGDEANEGDEQGDDDEANESSTDEDEANEPEDDDDGDE